MVQMYVHRSGRTARADTDGISIAIVSPSDCAKYTTLCRALDKVGIYCANVLVLHLHPVSPFSTVSLWFLCKRTVLLCCVLCDMVDLVWVSDIP